MFILKGRFILDNVFVVCHNWGDTFFPQKSAQKTRRWVLCLKGSASTCKWQITKAALEQNGEPLRAMHNRSEARQWPRSVEASHRQSACPSIMFCEACS